MRSLDAAPASDVPLLSQPVFWLGAIGWLLALTYLGLELYHRQRSVGAFVLPFILVFFLAAQLAPADRLSPPAALGDPARAGAIQR